MKTIILPGFSPHNKDWAEDMAKRMNLGHQILVHNWLHWGLGGGLKLRQEIEYILREVGSGEVNIIAKSVGTYVVAKVLPKIDGQVKKIILCGIPSTSEKRKEIYDKGLANFPSENIICFQNDKDPFASYDEVKNFMGFINPKVVVVKKPRSDHNYPYFEDFKNYLEPKVGP